MVDIGKSIRRRLLVAANDNGMEYMKILVRYLHERLLFRVSVSDYRDNFCLKGGSLLYAYQGLANRPTLDIDLLADRISNSKEHLKYVFSCICKIECETDGVSFDIDQIVAEDITIDHRYPGTKLTIITHLDTIRQPISIDIGFGDVVTPQPIEIIVNNAQCTIFWEL